MARPSCIVDKCKRPAAAGRLTCLSHRSGRDAGDPRGSFDVRIAQYLADATADHGNLEAGRPAVESWVLRDLAIAEGRLSPAARLMPPDADPKLLRLFTLPLGEGIVEIFELSGMTMQEWQAMELLLQGYSREGIRRQMTPTRFRDDKARWLSADTVSQYLWRGRRKLRELIDRSRPSSVVESDASGPAMPVGGVA